MQSEGKTPLVGTPLTAHLRAYVELVPCGWQRIAD
jgi:hypothetical protein